MKKTIYEKTLFYFQKNAKYILTFVFLTSLSSVGTLALIETNRANSLYPKYKYLKSIVKRLDNSIRFSIYNKKSWNYNNQTIKSGIYNIDKIAYKGKDFIVLREKTKKGYPAPSGYIDLLDNNILLGSNGKARIFAFSLKNKDILRCLDLVAREYGGEVVDKN